jgi:hypothetical protein
MGKILQDYLMDMLEFQHKYDNGEYRGNLNGMR